MKKSNKSSGRPAVKVRDLKPIKNAKGGFCAGGKHIDKGIIIT